MQSSSESGRFERVAALMGRMAGGGKDALYELYWEFGSSIGGALRRELRRLGVGGVRAEDVDGLVLDVCLDLFDRAGSWDAAHGVLPWTWARFRLRALAGAWVGQFADALPEGGLAEAAATPAASGGAAAFAPAAEPEALALFDGLAARRPDVGLLREGLARVSRPAQQAILLEVKLQGALGDPSPAVTVGRQVGMRPDAVRQTVKRVLDRLRHLAETDDRFAPLTDLHLVAA